MAETPILPATERFRRHVGADAIRRPPLSLARALAGFASLLVGAALLTIGVDVVLRGGSGVGLAVVFAGYAVAGLVLATLRTPAYRTAGVVATAVSVPGAVGFLVLELGHISSRSLSSTLAVSTVAWGLLHVIGPTRGHPILLGATLLGAWTTVLVGLGVLALGEPGTLRSPEDLAASAVASLVFGAIYMWAGWALDRSGLAGTATGFLGAGLAALGTGVVLVETWHSLAVAGILLITGGAVVAWLGRSVHRPVVTRAGAAAWVTGLAAVAVAAADGAVLGPAVGAALAGGVLVAVAPLLAPDDASVDEIAMGARSRRR